MPAEEQGRGACFVSLRSPIQAPSPAFRLGGVPPAFLTGSVGFYVRWLSPLRPLLAVQLLISKVKYTYQKLNIHKSKLLNCNINIKNPNQNQTFSNSVPALLQSKIICIFAHSE